ncbi:DinB family protein [Fibrella aestuarina]|nr:DinB family protein [Fibrella aestuarina]
MTLATARPDVLGAIQHITDWFNSPGLADAWTRPQGEKWTIEQEVAHLLRSTYGLVQLYGEPARVNWRPTDRPSRSYDEIVAQYNAGLEQLPPTTNAAIRETQPKSLVEQNTAWHQTLAAVEALLPTLSDMDLTGNTVWKHPILGPVTGLEMLFFTTHHTYHHLASLKRKQGNDER